MNGLAPRLVQHAVFSEISCSGVWLDWKLADSLPSMTVWDSIISISRKQIFTFFQYNKWLFIITWAVVYTPPHTEFKEVNEKMVLDLDFTAYTWQRYCLSDVNNIGFKKKLKSVDGQQSSVWNLQRSKLHFSLNILISVLIRNLGHVCKQKTYKPPRLCCLCHS